MVGIPNIRVGVQGAVGKAGGGGDVPGQVSARCMLVGSAGVLVFRRIDHCREAEEGSAADISGGGRMQWNLRTKRPVASAVARGAVRMVKVLGWVRGEEKRGGLKLAIQTVGDQVHQ